MAGLKKREIERIYTAIRPRLKLTATLAGGGSSAGTVPPHTHSADQISNEAAGDVASTDVQNAIEELAEEKLARDGHQPMTGSLDLDGFDIENVYTLFLTGAALIDGAETIQMTGPSSSILSLGDIEFDLSPTHTHTEGGLHWNDTPGIDRLALDVSDGQTLHWGGVYVQVRNLFGSPIAAGRAVKVISQGSAPHELRVEPFDETMPFYDDLGTPLLHLKLGVTMHVIPDGATGWVCLRGVIDGDFGAYGGGPVYAPLAGSGGLMEQTPMEVSRPACAWKTVMGIILDPSSPGTMYVDPVTIPRLTELSDTDLTRWGGPSDYDVPMWMRPLSGEATLGCDGWRDYPASLFPRRIVTEPAYFIEEKDVYIAVDASSEPVTVTLPGISDPVLPAHGEGRKLIIKKIDATLNRVTILASVGGIDGESSQQLKRKDEAVQLVSHDSSTGWWSH